VNEDQLEPTKERLPIGHIHHRDKNRENNDLTRGLTVKDDICFRELRVLYSSKGIRYIPVVDEHNHLEGMVNIRAIFDEILAC